MDRDELIKVRDRLNEIIQLYEKAGTVPSISVVQSAKILAELDLNKPVRGFYREQKKALLERVKSI